jgi:hypothetical protein
MAAASINNGVSAKNMANINGGNNGVWRNGEKNIIGKMAKEKLASKARRK